MATAEAVQVQGGAGAAVYDGFISYSHAADDLLAPRLQTGLQRFAKPWWKRRAVRIFRDEASLSANPHLWSSITDALDRSDWFVLLMSPDAADSDWVNQEVEYWLEHRDPARIIPVLTDGEFDWAESNVTGSAMPPSLRGAFSDEPRWVDLRFARREDQLDLNNAAFRAAVADVSSAIRGIPKDELESEEVLQHRRTTRTAWAAGIGLVVLLALSVVAAIFALDQQNEAEQLAASEAEARQEADANAALAAENEQAARDSEAAASEFAELVLANTARRDSPAAPAGGDFVHADTRNIPLPVAETPPATPRLDLLDVVCNPNCSTQAVFLHPTEPDVASAWVAGDPFHIRHGFPNPDPIPLGSSFPPDFEVLVYITRVLGPPLEDGAFELGKTHRYTPNYLVRTTSDRCGPGYLEQTGSQPCDEFVHEFPSGLPPGAYTFWVEWHAPCSFWTATDVCAEQGSLTLFAAEPRLNQGFGGFYADSFRPEEHFPDLAGDNIKWPFDPWQRPPTPDQ
jgi:hypothetical protein